MTAALPGSAAAAAAVERRDWPSGERQGWPPQRVGLQPLPRKQSELARWPLPPCLLLHRQAWRLAQLVPLPQSRFQPAAAEASEGPPLKGKVLLLHLICRAKAAHRGLRHAAQLAALQSHTTHMLLVERRGGVREESREERRSAEYKRSSCHSRGEAITLTVPP